MKKLVMVLLAVVLLGVPAYAAHNQREIIDETLSITNAVAEEDIDIAGAKKVTFFATINNNRTTAAVTATVTAAVSLNGTDWTDISWMDVAGGVTPQTTESTTLKKQTYVGWLDNRVESKYLRIRIKSGELEANYDSRFVAADNATLSVTVAQDR